MDSTAEHVTSSRRSLLKSLVAGTAASASAACLDVVDTPVGDGEEDDDAVSEGLTYDVETVSAGFGNPWALEHVPDTRYILVTERPGRLHVLDRDTGEAVEVDGAPEVHDAGQGGLLDVEIHPGYLEESWVYLTYSTAAEGGSTTALGRGRLDVDAAELTEFQKLFQAEPAVTGSLHYGSRVAFDRDGYLYVTVGDRGSKEFDEGHHSQNRSNDLGAVHRLTPEGDVPDDNPYVDDSGSQDTIYSYGHRNNQGLVIHPDTGEIWMSEHGEEDGDEINVVEAGGNYGWPVAHTGCRYGTSDPVGDSPFDRDDVVDPLHTGSATPEGIHPPA